MLKELYNHTKAIILAHGYVGEILGKTINGILMHSYLFDVVSIIDKNKVGKRTSQICPGVLKDVPIYPTCDFTLRYKPEVMILIGDPGKENAEEIKFCIKQGMDIINSSFDFLNEYSEYVNLAKKHNARLIDLRNVDRIGRDPDGSILNIKSKVVFVSGTDCGLGKRTACRELVNEATKRGIKAAFAATGQTGLMIGCDKGILFDALPHNYTAGAIEKLITDLDDDGFEIVFLEGQASLMHYGTSSSLALLHASNPHAIVLVHDPTRSNHVAYGDNPIFKMCELEREISIIENIYLPGGNRFKVVAIPTIGNRNILHLQQKTSLAVADVRQPGGAAIILDAVIKHLHDTYNWQPSTQKILI